VALGDFNGDGQPDLAVVNSGSGNVSILLGKGDGTFQSALTYHVSNTPLFAAVGDFNGDHKLDLAVANGSENTVSILIGNGDGTFQSPLQDNSGSFAGYVAVADFNGDGKIDLLTLNNQLSTTGENTIGILLGNGDGTFQSAVISSFSTDGFTPSRSAAIGDFNGDGREDVAVGSGTVEHDEDGNGNLVILLGNGDGTFQPLPAFDVGFKPLYFVTGKFTEEGKIDLAIAARDNVFGSDIRILLGNGDGTFSPASNPEGTQGYGFGENLGLVAVADVDHDSHLDVIGWDSVDTASHPTGLQVMLGLGNGTFQNPASCNQSSDCVQPSSVPSFLATGDFNGDGLPDLVVANVFANTVSIFLNRTPKAAPLPDFSLSPASANLTVQPGGQVSDVITLTPQNGAFGSIVQLTCAIAGPAPLPTCVLSPSSVAPGANPVTTTLAITAPAAAAMQMRWSRPELSKSLYAVGLPLLLGIALVGGSKTNRRRHPLFCGLFLVLSVLQMACGGGINSSGNGTPSPMNYTVTVAGVSGTIEHTAQVIVTVQSGGTLK
jgi:hypothetical protein